MSSESAAGRRAAPFPTQRSKWWSISLSWNSRPKTPFRWIESATGPSSSNRGGNWQRAASCDRPLPNLLADKKSAIRMTASIRRIIDTYEPDAALAKASTPPSSWYSDARILALERRSVLSRSWQMVGRAEQARKPGQYLTWEIAGESLLAV